MDNELLNLKFKSLFLDNSVDDWKGLEKKIEALGTTKERGDAFEEFVYLFFLTHKEYYQIDQVHMHPIPDKIKEKLNIIKYDAGIDGVILRLDGRLVAYQAKFRTGRIKPGYGELSKLWAEAIEADLTYVVANCAEVTELAGKQEKNRNILVDRFDSLKKECFQNIRELLNNFDYKKTQLKPWNHQEKIIDDVLKGFESSNRGKVIAACGTGKTMTALWINESLNSKSTLFVAPSLALIKQTLEEWSDYCSKPFLYICICSDRTVADSINQEFTDELGDYRSDEVDFHVTTSPEDLSKFLAIDGAEKIVFSTYQSLGVVAESLSHSDFKFDFACFDEAHRTAGVRETELFNIGLDDDKIGCHKRLFMTATERLIKPSLKGKLKEDDSVELFSMDDKVKYGPLFSSLNFGEAIQQEIIADYRIVLAAITSKELFDITKKNEKFLSKDLSPNEYFTFAQSVCKQVLLANAIRDLKLEKVISFHSAVRQAQAFIVGSGAGDYRLVDFFKQIIKEKDEDSYYLGHVNGTMSASKRKEILDDFKMSPFGLVSNAQCLTEGVNLPEVDTIYFVDSKHSMIDIIQACGRAMRKSKKEKKIATILIPILIDDSVSEEEFINNQEFTTIHNVVQALRDQDERLANWINQLNMSAAQKKTVRCGKFKGREHTQPISILSNDLNLDYLSSKIALRIATINHSAKSLGYSGSKLGGKLDRKSSVPRLFKTMGDYGIQKYDESLVTPTIEKIRSNTKEINESYCTTELKVNNNNISHSVRLGILRKEGKVYYLTPVGQKLLNRKTSFDKIFERQLINYYIRKDSRVLFPYAACLYILSLKGRLTFLEFVYALYSLQGSSSEHMKESIKMVDYIRSTYPIVENLSPANKKAVIADLNSRFNKEYEDTDIWGIKQTTINNQFIYFKNHLKIFGNLLEFKSMEIILNRGNVKKINEYLSINPHFNIDKDIDIKKLESNYFK